MNQKIENNSSSMNDKDLKYHSDKIGRIIERLEKNHFKWYVIQMTIVVFSITIFTFAFNSFEGLGSINKVFIYIFFGIVVNSLSLISFYNSYRYLKIGRNFRKIENKMYKDKKEPNYNWRIVKSDLKVNFIFWTSLFFVIIILFLSILIPLLHEINL